MEISLAAVDAHRDALDPLVGVEARSLTGDEASDWLARVAGLRHAVDGVLAALSSRIDEPSSLDAGRDRFARAKGYSSAQQLIANVGDLGSGDANNLVSVGRAMAAAEDAPALLSDAGDTEPALYAYLCGAVARGELGTEKAAVIRAWLEELSNATVELERSLVDRARRKPLRDVREMCARELANLEYETLREREKRNRARRFVSFKDQGDGMVWMSGLLDNETIAPLRAWIEPQVQAQLNSQRDWGEEERRHEGQIRADVLADMARHLSGCQKPASGLKTALVVRVNKDDLERGVGLAECDQISGPITVECLRAMAVDAGVIPAVMGGGSLPLDLGRVTRLFTDAQRIALGERDGGCAMCPEVMARCNGHHIRFWGQDGTSDLRNGVMLCVGCHHRLHDFGWDVEVDERDSVWFIPPASVDPARRRQPGRAARLLA